MPPDESRNPILHRPDRLGPIGMPILSCGRQRRVAAVDCGRGETKTTFRGERGLQFCPVARRLTGRRMEQDWSSTGGIEGGIAWGSVIRLQSPHGDGAWCAHCGERGFLPRGLGSVATWRARFWTACSSSVASSRTTLLSGTRSGRSVSGSKARPFRALAADAVSLALAWRRCNSWSKAARSDSQVGFTGRRGAGVADRGRAGGSRRCRWRVGK